jgi:hypothetical protein
MSSGRPQRRLEHAPRRGAAASERRDPDGVDGFERRGSLMAPLQLTARDLRVKDERQHRTVRVIGHERRVLRPGGWLGLVYNLVTPASDWERELAALNPDQHEQTPDRPEPSWPFPTGEVSTTSVSWDWHVSPEHYRNCLGTHSAVIQLREADRRDRLDAAEAIVRQVCAEADSPTAPIHHEAFCLRWTPTSASA